MPHTDLQRLLDKGRKAGLGTSELYRALGSRRPEVGDPLRQTDGNGFISGYSANGQRYFRPIGSRPRS